MHRTPSCSKGFQGASSKKITTARPLEPSWKHSHSIQLQHLQRYWLHLESCQFMFIKDSSTIHINNIKIHVQHLQQTVLFHSLSRLISRVKGLFIDLISPLCAASSHILPEQLLIWNPSPSPDKSCCIAWFLLIVQTRYQKAKETIETLHQQCTAWLSSC